MNSVLFKSIVFYTYITATWQEYSYPRSRVVL